MTARANHEIEISDVEYLRHGDKPLLARLFRPRGTGPFPIIVEIHGGAWCLMDRTHDKIVNEALARSGVVVVALDFRMPPDAKYPGSMIDINFGIRWAKSRAAELNGSAERLGLMGSSSGGHQAMLAAMRPRDPRYASLPLPEGPQLDATVRCVVMLWPVIDPLGRYRYAKELKASGKPYPELVDLVLPLHDKYWKDEAEMAEGNPTMALERGERAETPPVLCVQGERDIAHPRPHLDRFISGYRKIGGMIDLAMYPDVAEGFIVRKPEAPASRAALDRIIDFVHTQLS
ncbi:MAG TPA: alpha/beta hydrolase [Candidatus Binataceae bacterium]|jgi:acetyl esterase/lipase|nr:alpha/beta hydrolase [Candidatus Binataceae bacterium]